MLCCSVRKLQRLEGHTMYRSALVAEQISKGLGKAGAKFTSFKKVNVRHHSKLYFKV